MSHIYRAYHAIQGLTSQKGLPTNAVYGFTNMIRKLLKEENPEYIGVAIDLVGPTVRHEKYRDYKSTRRPMPPDLVDQIPYIWQVCKVLRLPILSYEGYEADDVIGTLAGKAAGKSLEVVIVTIDKDMFQLVTDKVSILDTRTMARLDPKGVEEKFGVPPEQVLDVLSLMGDVSDNIPGAPGIGEKGAKQLITEYGSLENLLAHRQEIARRTYRESLEQNEDLVRQSRELLAIHKELPVELDLEQMRRSEPDYEAAVELFRELEFTTVMQEFLPTQESAGVQYEKIEDPEQLRALAERVENQRASLAFYYPLDNYLEGALRAISVSTEPRRAFFLSNDLIARHPEQFVDLLSKPSQWVIHDLKPFYFFAERQGWPRELDLLDTMLAAYLISPNQSDFSLERLALEQLEYKVRPIEGEEGKLFDRDVMDCVCERADVTLQLFNVLYPKLREKGLENLLREIEIPLVEVLAVMEKHGVKVDCELLKQMSVEMETEIDQLTQRIYSIAGTEFNINSPRQLGSVLFEKLNLPLAKKTRKAGHFATGIEVLEELAQAHEVVQLILDYRELTKLKNTYLDALPKLVNPRTGRIHTSYNQMVAATGRLSSSNPNLQNIPIKSEIGRKIRRAFIAEPGYQILAADYSQIELRIMAHLAQDPVLIESFRKGEDIHDRTAREVFGMNALMDPHEYRRRAKVINFGILYGLSAFGLAQSLKIGRSEAQKFIDDYFEKYLGVKAWIDRTLAEVQEKGYVTTLFGRIRPIPEIYSKNWSVKGFGERTAVNAPIQGTAADLIKKAMVSIYGQIRERNLCSKLILQVHDELVFEVADPEMEFMTNLVREQMESAADLSVPLKVDLAVGPSWFEAK